MSFPTTDAQGELQAVNQILASVGQAPVTTLEQTNPDVAIAYNTLQQVSREVQAEGWTFNKEYHYPMPPSDTEQEIKIPDNMLQIDLSQDEYYNLDKDSIRRGGRLYDRTAHTYKWDRTVYCDIVWLFDWVDLPTPIRDYITARAASLVAMRVVGDPTLYQVLSQQEGYMRSNALEYETSQGDYTFFGHPRGANYYSSYQPFHALYR
ncbi:MAG: hypothetical protein ACR2M9_02140 [Cyanophyceae cyanobacterium]